MLSARDGLQADKGAGHALRPSGLPSVSREPQVSLRSLGASKVACTLIHLQAFGSIGVIVSLEDE